MNPDEFVRGLGELFARVNAFLNGGDIDAVLDPDAVALGEELATFAVGIPQLAPRLRFDLVLGWFNWCLFRLLPADQGEPALRTALIWFELLSQHSPDAVPEDAKAFLDGVALSSVGSDAADVPVLDQLLDRAARGNETALDRAAREVLALVRDCGTVGDPEVVRWAVTTAYGLTARFDRRGAVADITGAIELTEAVLAGLAPNDPLRTGGLADLGSLYRKRFLATRSADDLRQAVKVGRRAVRLASGPGQQLLAAQTNLLNTLLLRSEEENSLPDIEEAVTLGRQVAAAVPPDHPMYGSVVTNLGNAVRRRFEHTADEADIAEAVGLLRQALGEPSGIRRQPADRIVNLSNALLTRFRKTAHGDDLDEAIELVHTAIEIGDERHPHFCGHLTSLAHELCERFATHGRPADHAEAIRVYDRALAIARGTGDTRAQAELALGLADLHRHDFERSNDLDALDEAIAWARRAVAGGGVRGPTMSAADKLGALLLLKLEHAADPAILAEAVALFDEAAQSMSSDDATGVSNLGNLRLFQYQYGGDPAHLDAALELIRMAASAVAARGTGSDAFVFGSMCNILRARYEYTGVASDLDEAIDAGRRAADTMGGDSAVQATVLTSLGLALSARAGVEPMAAGTDSEMLDEAIRITERAVASASGSPRRPRMVSNLAVMLSRLPDLDGRLDDAVTLAREAAADTARDNESYIRLWALSTVLLTRFRSWHDSQDLRDAIAAAQAAVDAAPDHGAYRTVCLTQLAETYATAPAQDSDVATLDRALSAAEQAVHAAIGDNGYAVDALLRLADVHKLRFQHTRDLSDLYDFVDATRRARAVMTVDSARYPLTTLRLASALRICFSVDRNLDLLDEAVEYLRHGAAEAPAGSQVALECRLDLASALRERFEHAHDDGDLDEAVLAAQQVLRAALPAFRAAALVQLASALRLRFLRFDRKEDLDRAVAAAEEAVESTRRTPARCRRSESRSASAIGSRVTAPTWTGVSRCCGGRWPRARGTIPTTRRSWRTWATHCTTGGGCTGGRRTTRPRLSRRGPLLPTRRTRLRTSRSMRHSPARTSPPNDSGGPRRRTDTPTRCSCCRQWCGRG